MEIAPQDDILQPDRIISCLLGPGDMLLWDSHLVHCSYPGKEESMSVEASNGGLIRAATLVSMIPSARATPRVWEQRKQAVHQCWTLTHWSNKVVPLGEEHEEEVILEARRVEIIRNWQAKKGTEVLLDFGDLTMEQQQLVVVSGSLESLKEQHSIYSKAV